MKIQVRRGLKADIPTLATGEFGFCTDTKELYIGSPEGNVLVNTPTGGPILLSDLTIDADKNWQEKAISNPGNVDGVDISAHATNVNAHHAQAHTLASHSTKAHTELTGVTEAQHHTKFTIAEHDTTTRHPVSVIKTATGSLTGNLPGTTEMNVVTHRKGFFPALASVNPFLYYPYATPADPGNYIGKFRVRNPSTIPYDYWFYWDYLSASGPPQIWCITDKDGVIQHCWEAEDASDPENPDLAPIEISNMAADWHSLKIEIPSDYGEIKKKAKEKKKSLSKHILDDYEVDVKNKKLKKKIEEV